LLIWAAANYIRVSLIVIRTGLAALIVWLIAQRAAGGWLAAGMLGLGLALPFGRPMATRRKVLAEWEVAVNVAAVLGTALLIGAFGLTARWTPIRLPASAGRLAVGCAAIAATVFLLRGAGQIVRGLLEKTEALPPPSPVDRHEFAEYFLIGTLASPTVAFFTALSLRALIDVLR